MPAATVRFQSCAQHDGLVTAGRFAVTLHGRALEASFGTCSPVRASWRCPGTARRLHLAGLLDARGMGRSQITVLEAMGPLASGCTSRDGIAFEISEILPLNTVAIEVIGELEAAFLALAPGLDDALFEHDGQLTKREIRAVTLSSLEPRYGELLWDIGLGAGSIAIEWLLRHPSLSAIGVEARNDRAERAARNAAALGVPELQIVLGRAPEALAGLARPDAAFVGGGMMDDGVFEAVWTALKPRGRLVANAVSLETEARLADYFGRFGGELIRLQVARADKVGTMFGWRLHAR